VTGQDSGLLRLLAAPSGVELRQLEAFVAVATELHFGRAAERLHLAAPTLSELIRPLERNTRVKAERREREQASPAA
jgi:DNA-binding transcriptional LysR family regulator